MFVGAFFVFFLTSQDPVLSVALAVGNSLEAVVATVLVQRFADGANAFQSSRTVFRFSAIAFVSATLTATLGAIGVLVFSRSIGDFTSLWLNWWLANLTGTLVIAPFVLLWTTTPISRPQWRDVPDILEALILLVLLVGVGLVVFAGGFPSDIQNYPLEFLCVPFFLWAAFRFGRREVATALAVVSGIAVWGTMRDVGPFARETTQESLILVQSYISVIAVMFVVLAAVVAEHKHAEGQLRELAITDPLTGLANYRRLLEVLRGEIARSRRTGRSFSVVFVDMDGLKSINDRFGHLVGSRALCRVGDALRRTSRALDTPARYGGDEFAIVLPETTEDGAKSVLKRIADRLVADPDKPVLSVSGGVAVFPRDGDSPTMLLRTADRALYTAKAANAEARSRYAMMLKERETSWPA